MLFMDCFALKKIYEMLSVFWNLDYSRAPPLNTFQPSVAIHAETRLLICTSNLMIGFYMKNSTGRKWLNT